MSTPPSTPQSRLSEALAIPSASEQSDVLRQWRQAISGRPGERGQLPETPDDPVAHALLNAAGIALGQGNVRGSVRILELAVAGYPRSQEAACARTVLDRLAARNTTRGR